MTTREWALEYAARGWRVLPIWSVDPHGRCQCGVETCTAIGKHPVSARVPHGVKDASADATVIATWWATEDYNIGIATGHGSGLTVVDVDVSDGKHGAESWRQLNEGHGDPPTLMARTGSGGMHVLLAYHATMTGKNNALGPNLDVKNEGGYIVAPPSRHRSGGMYEWLNWGTPVAAWPAHFVPQETRGRPRKDDPTRRKTYTLSEVIAMLAVIPAEDRHDWLTFGIILSRAFAQSDAAWEAYTAWANTYTGPRARGHDKAMHTAFYVTALKDPEREATMGTIVYRALAHGWTPDGGAVPIDQFVYVAPSNNYLYRSTGVEWLASGVDAVVSMINAEGTLVRPSAHLKRRAVTSVTSDPAIEGDLLPGFDCRQGTLVPAIGAMTFNLYRPATLELGTAALAAPWIEHTRRLLPKPGDADQIFDFLAHRVQHPGVKPRFALLLVGGQGIGKDTVVDMVVPAIGAWNVKSIEPKDLESPYNSYKACTLLRIHEAANLAEMSKWAFNETTKTLIAGGGADGCEINPKYGHQFTMRLYCGVIMTTNHLLSSIFIPDDDRRYDVLECATFREMGLLTPEARGEYFDALYTWFYAGGNRHIAAWLRARDVTRWSPDHGQRKTDAHARIVADGRVGDIWLMDVLMELEELGHVDILRGDWVVNRAVAGGEKLLEVNKRMGHAMDRAGYYKRDDRTQPKNQGRWRIGKKAYTVWVRKELDVTRQQILDVVQVDVF